MDPLLHSLFRPLQVNGSDLSTYYIEQKPSAVLKAYVACYWESGPANRVVEENLAASCEDTALLSLPHEETMERVLPDGCTDILLEYDPVNKRQELSYCGTFTQPFVSARQAGSEARIFAVRFFPGGAHYFHGMPTHLFTGGNYRLEDLWPESIAVIGERIMEAQNFNERVRIMDEYLNQLLLRRRTSDCDLMKNLLHRIFVSAGSVGVKELAECEAISERQLNRKFGQWIGISPKKFSEVVRFQSVLHSIQSGGDLDWTELALKHSFFDQAHLIRDFRRFYGDSPLTAVKDLRKLSDFYNTRPEASAILKI
ncbi:AraC family transcriptional regulator [Paenibacillus peoriae]|uniref:helix-turn-helix domain-containing protein n=1 Tax=Paenibacillus TaxID=44249 RepID=UPI0006A70896|nr:MULTISPECIES: helix-turn-helix domain-containing protein [Paenibacillus]ALA44666.1 AraC family transcriptional regulator [Paenibacillus peoriae]APB73550.1 transcriptional regulator FtrA [Paenibacillus polymyxa]POR29296.1 AraC family transcriptional regulator [Paenibacillus polymyxa]